MTMEKKRRCRLTRILLYASEMQAGEARDSEKSDGKRSQRESGDEVNYSGVETTTMMTRTSSRL